MALTKPDLNKPCYLFLTNQAELIKKCLCVSCENAIKESDFTSDKSKREYSISGMCQACQNKVFGDKNEH